VMWHIPSLEFDQPIVKGLIWRILKPASEKAEVSMMGSIESVEDVITRLVEVEAVPAFVGLGRDGVQGIPVESRALRPEMKLW
jgi:hypothetical protein